MFHGEGFCTLADTASIPALNNLGIPTCFMVRAVCTLADTALSWH